MSTPQEIKDRLEHLRSQLKAECISYEELAELQELATHIDPSDVELLEAAGVPENKATVYQALKDAEIEMFNRESDLFVNDTPEARQIIADHSDITAKTFRSNIDGTPMLELPFCYQPFWDKVNERSEALKRANGS
jgi:hypothetical protein